MNNKPAINPLIKSIFQRIWDFKNNKTYGKPDTRPTYPSEPTANFSAWDQSATVTAHAVAEAIQAVQWNHEDLLSELEARGIYPQSFGQGSGTDNFSVDFNTYIQQGNYYLTCNNTSAAFVHGPDSDRGNNSGQTWPWNMKITTGSNGAANYTPNKICLLLEVYVDERTELLPAPKVIQHFVTQRLTLVAVSNNVGQLLAPMYMVATRHGRKSNSVSSMSWNQWTFDELQPVPVKMTSNQQAIIGSVYYSNGNHTLTLPSPSGYPVGSTVTLIQNVGTNGKVVCTSDDGAFRSIDTECDTADNPSDPVSMIYRFEIDYDENLNKEWKILVDSNYTRPDEMDDRWFVKYPRDFYTLDGEQLTLADTDESTQFERRKVVPFDALRTFYNWFKKHAADETTVNNVYYPHATHLSKADVYPLLTDTPPSAANYPRSAARWDSVKVLHTDVVNLTDQFNKHNGAVVPADADPHNLYLRRGFTMRTGGGIWIQAYKLQAGVPTQSPAFALTSNTPRIVNINVSNVNAGFVIELPKIAAIDANNKFTGIQPYDEVRILIDRTDVKGYPVWISTASGDTVCASITNAGYGVMGASDATENYISICLVAVATSIDTTSHTSQGDWQPIGGRNSWHCYSETPLTTGNGTAVVKFIDASAVTTI